MGSFNLQSDLIFTHFGEEIDNDDELDSELVEYILSLENPNEIFLHVEKLKCEGNNLFKQRNFGQAIDVYRVGIVFLSFASTHRTEDASKYYDLVLAFNLNLAACCLKVSDYVRAKRFCSMVLRHSPDNVKALFRRATASAELGEIREAREDLKKASEIDPTDKDVINKLKQMDNLLDSSRVRKRSSLESIEDRKGKRVMSGAEVFGETSNSKNDDLIKRESMLVGESTVSSSMVDHVETESMVSGITDDGGLETKKTESRKKHHVFTNKIRRSDLKISAADYERLSQGKTLKFYQVRHHSVMTVRIHNLQQEIPNPVSQLPRSPTLDIHPQPQTSTLVEPDTGSVLQANKEMCSDTVMEQVETVMESAYKLDMEDNGSGIDDVNLSNNKNVIDKEEINSNAGLFPFSATSKLRQRRCNAKKTLPCLSRKRLLLHMTIVGKKRKDFSRSSPCSRNLLKHASSFLYPLPSSNLLGRHAQPTKEEDLN